DNTACVQNALTLLAPLSKSRLAALHRVPPVSIISSTSITFFPSTFPIRVISATSLARLRYLSQITMSALNCCAYILALLTLPTSGDAKQRLSHFCFLI